MERIKAAINRAKEARGGAEAPVGPRPPVTSPDDAVAAPPVWQKLAQIEIDEEQLRRSRIVTYTKEDPAHVPFDILRTKVIKLMERHGWRSIAITSPTMGCGKTMIATNLAFSFARQRTKRTVLADIDLKRPQLRKVIGIDTKLSMGDYLSGSLKPEEYFLRVGDNLAIGATYQSFRHSAELLQHEHATEALDRMKATLQPDFIIYDLPPMLASDDAMSFIAYADCALLIAASGTSTIKEIDDCERMLSELVPIAGVILNKFDLKSDSYYYYDYEYA